jgi:hypothetical protein
MIPRYQIFRKRIESDLTEARRAAQKAAQAFDQAQHDPRHATFYLDSTALNLHGFYSGLERIFEWLARELDGGLPSGPAWHHDLLSQMTLDVEGLRPAVIQPQTAEHLAEYLRFRHLVRNLYTWSFETGKLAALIHGLPGVLAALESDLANFARFLDAASLADELNVAE